MIKRTMILADSDEVYMERLSNYFMEKSPQLELNIFTDQELLLRYLSGHKTDILVVGDGFLNEKLVESANASVNIILSGSNSQAEGFETIQKYQKTEAILNEILLKYAEKTGATEAIRGSSNTRVVAFYSPAGGTGKTTLALGMAAAGAKSGRRTLYLNLEEIDSVQPLFPKSPGDLSDVFLSLKTKGMNVGIKMATCVGRDPVSGFSYVSGVESISEYEEIDGADLGRLIEGIRAQAEYDLLILDLSSAFSESTRKVLEHADVIFSPITSEEGAIEKLRRFLNETGIHENYNSIIGNMRLVVNRSDPTGPGVLLRQSRLLEQLQYVACVAEQPLFAARADILRSGEALIPVFQPLLAGMTEEKR